MGNAILKIGDGTSANTVNLLDLLEGLDVEGWRQAVAQFKAGGVFSQSALAEGRRLVAKRFANVQETFPIPAATEEEADITAWAIQKLLRVCQLASDYWVETWRTAPVYLESRADCETESRYAVVHWAGLPELGDVYSAEFLRHAVMQDLSLVAERGHWQSTVPTTADCVQISGQGTAEWGETTVIVSVGDNTNDAGYNIAAAEVLDFANVTLYIGNSGGSYYFGMVFTPVNVPAGVTILSASIEFEANGNTGNDDVQVIIEGEAADNPATWFDLADFVSRPKTAAKVDWPVILGTSLPAWVDTTHYGTPDLKSIVQETVDRPGWASGQRMIFYVSDSGSDSNAHRAAASHDLGGGYDPAQLTIIYSSSGATVGRAATCTEEVYVANKRNSAGLSHIFVDDGGVFGANQIANTAFNLLPAVPVVNDVVYFGIQSSLVNSGPFSSLIFDVVAGDDYFGNWEYFDSGTGWTQLSDIMDRTDFTFFGHHPWENNGVAGVFWKPVSTWTPVAINGVTAWWVRFEVTAVVAPTGPQQQNREVYTITWDSITAAAAQIGGDISALARHLLRDQAGYWMKPYTTLPMISRIICGLRSESRGADFEAILNLADQSPAAQGPQNPAGMYLYFASALTTAQTVVECATGVAARFNPVAPVEAMADRIVINFDPTIASQYSGRYRAYIRAEQDSGSAGDFYVKLRVELGDGMHVFETESVATYVTGQWMLLDLGTAIVPAPVDVLAGEDFRIKIKVQASSSNNAANLDFYDLALIPIDEWAGDFMDSDRIGEAAATSWRRRVEIDSALNPRVHVRGIVEDDHTGYVEAVWLPIVNGPVQLRQNTDQRLYFLFSRYTAAGVEISEPFSWSTVQSFAARRYLGMRGAN